MFRSLVPRFAFFLALFKVGVFAQVPTPSTSPKITTATCGKPACTWTAYSNTYSRQAGPPQDVSNTFSIPNPNAQFTLHIDNNRVSSAIISINGIQVFGPSDFNENVTSLDRAVTLSGNNTVQVELRSKPGTLLAIMVIGVDNDPPSVIESQSPPPNAFGWNNGNVDVSFTCADATSGIAVCPKPVLLTTEGLNQVVTGTTFDLAGNSETASLQISIDETPPTILPAQNPPANSFGWNNTPVTVTFSCNDNLSGVQSCNPAILLSNEGQNQSVIGSATDFAGNSASASTAVSIDLTPPALSISSPTNASTVTTPSIAIMGSVSDNLSGLASLACNGFAAIISNGGFNCNVSLIAGANTVQVLATDKAGNTATAQITVVFNATPAPAPNSILITPSLVNVLVGDTRLVNLIGDIGQPVFGATWSISDPTIVTINSADSPQLTALAQGTATLTANFKGLTAAMTINVLSGSTLTFGTPLWAFDPLPGNTILEMVPGNPIGPGDPYLFSIEAPRTLRAFTKDGMQLWAVSPGVSSALTAPSSSASAIGPLNAVNRDTAPLSLVSIPSDEQGFLRKHRAFDNLDLLLRQQHFIDHYRHRHPSVNPSNGFVQATPVPSSLSPANDTVADSTVLLIKAVADNNGGTINLVETFSGCCQITQSSLIKIDNATQQQVWRHDFSSAIDESFAIGDDNTIYSSQLIFTGTTNLFFGSSSNSLIFALDGNTGQEKFNLPLPPGHINVTVTNPRFNPSSTVVADLDVAAQPGPLSILPDGSIKAVVYTNHLTEVFNSFTLSPHSETAVSDHKTLQLLTIQPDGSFATQPVQAFDFDQTSCAAGCSDPGAGYVPNEVVPDGQGGLLATWTGNDAGLGITSSSAALVRHFDNAGGTLDYVVPFASSSWFRVGGNNPQALILGENNTAFGSDGQSIIAFDVNTGAQLWSFQPGGFQGSALLAASVQGNLMAVQLGDVQGSVDANPNALLAFDPSGAASAMPFFGGNADVSYFDANALLAVAGTGVGEMVQGLASLLDEANVWNLNCGNVLKQRSANSPKIKIEKLISFNDDNGLPQSMNVPLVGIGNQKPETVKISSNQALNPSSQFTVQLTLQKSGSGTAAFSDGTTSMKITPAQSKPAIIQLQGGTISSKADDITLIAKRMNSNVANKILASQNFSVVNVRLSMNPGGHVSPDDSVRDAYISFSGVGSDTLGPVVIPFSQGILSGCRTAVELVGTVSPVDYKGKVVLRRNLLEASAWVQNTFQSFVQAGPDNSFPENRDDNPASSNGHAYDIDLPGLRRAQQFIGLIKRFRQNFSEFAVLDSENNGVPVSQQPLSWYSRTSCNVTNIGPQFLNDIPGDNQAGQGCTKLSLDLLSNDHAGTVCVQTARRPTGPAFRLASAIRARPPLFAFGFAKCEALATSDLHELIHYLQSTGLENPDPQCIQYAIKRLGDGRLAEAAPVLASYLAFHRPETDQEKMGMGGQLETPGNEFPAVWALAQLGKAALPVLANTIEDQKNTAEISKNAVYATVLIFDKGPGAIKFLKRSAAAAKSSIARHRFMAAAREALNWCRAADHAACEAALGEKSK